MTNNLTKLLLVFTVLLSAGRCALTAADDANHRAGGERMVELIHQYEADGKSMHFFELPGCDGYLDRLLQLQDDWRSRLDALDFDTLGRSDQVDYLLLRNEVERSRDAAARQRKRLAEVEHLLGFGPIIYELEQSRWRAVPLDCPAVAAKLETLVKQVKELHRRVEKGCKRKAEGQKSTGTNATAGPKEGTQSADVAAMVVAPALALRAAKICSELRQTLKAWAGFYEGYHPDFAWWLKQPSDEAGKQLEQYAKLLREEVAGCKGKDEDPLVGDPIGAEAIAAKIRFEFLPYTAEELITIGQRELSRCDEEMKAASRAMGLGDDWKAALGKVKADYAAPGRQDVLVAQLAGEAADFVTARNLLTVPPLCRETWRATMLSAKDMKTIPYAAYGGQEILLAYAKDEMKHDDKLMAMRGNNRHFTRLVVPHELIPGHHLQGFYAARYNAHRRLFWTPFYVEGWALYWELRLWDAGWATTPEDRIGMLFWRSNRCARIIVGLKFHLGQMSPQQMIDFLIDRVGHEKLGATSEVRRYIQAEPLYQAAYMLGGLQLYALQKELVGSGKMTDQQFHDAVLKENSMPIELLRADLLRLPLSRAMQPAWKFAAPSNQ